MNKHLTKIAIIFDTYTRIFSMDAPKIVNLRKSCDKRSIFTKTALLKHFSRQIFLVCPPPSFCRVSFGYESFPEQITSLFKRVRHHFKTSART